MDCPKCNSEMAIFELEGGPLGLCPVCHQTVALEEPNPMDTIGYRARVWELLHGEASSTSVAVAA